MRQPFTQDFIEKSAARGPGEHDKLFGRVGGAMGGLSSLLGAAKVGPAISKGFSMAKSAPSTFGRAGGPIGAALLTALLLTNPYLTARGAKAMGRKSEGLVNKVRRKIGYM